MSSLAERLFHLKKHGTTVGTEVRAGTATFLTLAYILAVNPQILSQAGLPANDVVFATAVSSAIACFMMGLYANLPFALAPGMGINAWFTFGVVIGMGVDWRTALTAVLVEGILFLILSLAGIRTALINAIPLSVKLATTVGIGLFLAFIGFRNAGLVTGSEATLVELGNLRSSGTWLALGTLVLISAMLARKVKGALLFGIGIATAVAWLTGLAPTPDDVFAWPSLPTETLFAFDFTRIFNSQFVVVVLSFLFVDIFDTAGVLLGVARMSGMTDEKGELPHADRAFTADAAGTIVGAMLGTSTVTTYLESAAGVEEGGRTGLTAMTTGALLLVSLFFVPLLAAVPGVATAPALIAVAASMITAVGALKWTHFDEVLPAFLTIALMPFTFSIANGIAAGIVSWVLLKVVGGRFREVKPGLAIVAVLLVAWYALGR